MQQFITSDSVAFVHDDVGPSDGVPVVLCHGLGAAGAQLLADAEYFARLGYRVLVPDLRGHGRSGKPPAMRREDFSIARMAADLSEMLDAADVGPVHWVGNSLGGILALHMLDREAARFRTLATFGTAHALHLPAWTAGAIPLVYRLLGRNLTAALTGRGTTRDRAGQRLVAEMIRNFDPEVGRLVAANVANYDFGATAAAARLPMLLLRGGRDRQVNAALKPTLTAMRGRPNFTLVELPEGGHVANLDATEPWRAALLRFWAEADAG